MTCPSCAKTVKVPVGRFEDGCIIGDFLIKSKIGEGSIGAVYLATQLSLERQVALVPCGAPRQGNHKKRQQKASQPVAQTPRPVAR